VIVIDGNDGLGKSTLVERLKAFGYRVADRGMPTKATDDGIPDVRNDGETYVILDAPIEVSRARLEKAGKDMNEHWHTVKSLTHYRQRFQEVAKQLGVPLIDASGSPEDVLLAVLRHLDIQPRRWGIWLDTHTPSPVRPNEMLDARWWGLVEPPDGHPMTGASHGTLKAYDTHEEAEESAARGRADHPDWTFTPKVLSVLRVGIPKGRLMPEVCKRIGRMFMAGDELFIGRSYRTLLSAHRFGSLDLVLVKPRSIPQMLALGMIDIGFCGHDIARESQLWEDGPRSRNFIEDMADLETNRVQMVVAARDPNILSSPPTRAITIATEYPHIADQWASRLGLAHICVNTYGSTEAWVPTFCDICIDIVETGETMRANGLTVLDEIMSSSTSMFTRRDDFSEAYLRPGPIRDHAFVHVMRNPMSRGEP
jgi:ATP phosphoribosyltransferase